MWGATTNRLSISAYILFSISAKSGGGGVIALPLPALMPASKKAACWHFPISWLLSRPQRPAHVAATAETAEISITSVVEFEGSWSDIYNLDFMISLGDYIKIDRKWMLLLNDCYKTLSGHFLYYLSSSFTKLRSNQSVSDAQQI